MKSPRWMAVLAKLQEGWQLCHSLSFSGGCSIRRRSESEDVSSKVFSALYSRGLIVKGGRLPTVATLEPYKLTEAGKSFVVPKPESFLAKWERVIKAM